MPPRTVRSASRLCGGVFFRNISVEFHGHLAPARTGPGTLRSFRSSGLPLSVGCAAVRSLGLLLDHDDLDVGPVVVVDLDRDREVPEPLDRLVEQDLLLVDVEAQLVEGVLDVAGRHGAEDDVLLAGPAGEGQGDLVELLGEHWKDFRSTSTFFFRAGRSISIILMFVGGDLEGHLPGDEKVPPEARGRR